MIFEYIRKEINSKGKSPSTIKIQRKFGYKSASTAQYHVDKICDAGLLVKGFRKLTLPEKTKPITVIAKSLQICGEDKTYKFGKAKVTIEVINA